MTGGFEAEAFNHPAPRTADEAETWVQCPYDKNHYMPAARLQWHIFNCRLRHDLTKYKPCPFNELHWEPLDKIDAHIKVCPDKDKFVLKDIGFGPTWVPKDILKDTGSVVGSNDPVVEAEDLWQPMVAAAAPAPSSQFKPRPRPVEQPKKKAEPALPEIPVGFESLVDSSKPALSKNQKKHLKRKEKKDGSTTSRTHSNDGELTNGDDYGDADYEDDTAPAPAHAQAQAPVAATPPGWTTAQPAAARPARPVLASTWSTAAPASTAWPASAASPASWSSAPAQPATPSWAPASTARPAPAATWAAAPTPAAAARPPSARPVSQTPFYVQGSAASTALPAYVPPAQPMAASNYRAPAPAPAAAAPYVPPSQPSTSISMRPTARPVAAPVAALSDDNMQTALDRLATLLKRLQMIGELEQKAASGVELSDKEWMRVGLKEEVNGELQELKLQLGLA